jgi:hypothetical protein
MKSNPFELAHLSPRFEKFEDDTGKYSIMDKDDFSLGSQRMKILKDLEKKNVTMRDYFRLIVLSVKANVPLFMMNEVIRRKDADEMYERAKE